MYISKKCCIIFFKDITEKAACATFVNYISNYAVRFVIDWISVLSRFASFGYGRFDFAALLYYLSLTSVFIFLTVRVYEKRRWS